MSRQLPDGVTGPSRLPGRRRAHQSRVGPHVIEARWKATSRSLNKIAISAMLATVALTVSFIGEQNPTAVTIALALLPVAGILCLFGYFGLLDVPDKRAYRRIKMSIWLVLASFAMVIGGFATKSPELSLAPGLTIIIAWVFGWMCVIRIGVLAERRDIVGFSIAALVAAVLALGFNVAVRISDYLQVMLISDPRTMRSAANLAGLAYYPLAAAALWRASRATREVIAAGGFRARARMVAPEAALDEIDPPTMPSDRRTDVRPDRPSDPPSADRS